MRVKFYLDEDVPVSLTQALLNRGVNISTTQDSGNVGNTDIHQLNDANQENRVIITHNKKDFIKLHKEFLDSNRQHCGIIVSDQLPIGVLLKRVMKLWFTVDANDMKNRLEFLSSWK